MKRLIKFGGSIGPAGTFGFAIVAILLLTAVISPIFTPYDPNAIDVLNRMAPPNWDHWFGTDHLGRDLLSRHMVGTSVAMAVALGAAFIALVGGTILGLMAAYMSGYVERVILIVFDAIASYPSVILALAAVAVLGSSMVTISIVIGFALIPHFGRVARAQTLAIRRAPFVEAEIVLGASEARILLHHILPNIAGPLIVLASLDIPIIIAIEAGMSFLGLGIRPPSASWGVLLQDGYQNLSESMSPVLISCGVLAAATLAFTLMGEALRELGDPRSVKGGA
ncbi:ABC transporter permease [Devosia sp. YIM 151766]|uniref:ABC transporter permease n=1 Tax=Devosia sp. YIM 151766 TaxID=3017325 RepID=UPI00255C8EF4|nr:ABC transporter permease [Devosia sp. YIM 151766]WIY52551.1 ABC transporter permease [Devosia sp. YIM 151766]